MKIEQNAKFISEIFNAKEKYPVNLICIGYEKIGKNKFWTVNKFDRH